MKRLEVILDTRLVQRSARGLSLTYSGQTFLVFARRLLQVRDGAVEAAKAEQQALSGNIRVAAPIAIVALAAILNRLAQLDATWQASILSLVTSLDVASIVPDTTGLAAAAPLLREDVLTVMTGIEAFLATYNSVAYRQTYTKIGGLSAAITS